jgi:hypothetical protein
MVVTMTLRRMDVLAEKLVPWEPMNHKERLALLADRTKPAGGVLAWGVMRRVTGKSGSLVDGNAAPDKPYQARVLQTLLGTLGG